jgi:ABC-type transporter Mla subunit MlaD
MTIQVVLTVVEILLLVGVLAYFLTRLDRVLANTAANLGRIAEGAKAIDAHCQPIGPLTTEINALLGEAAGSLQSAARRAQAL